MRSLTAIALAISLQGASAHITSPQDTSSSEALGNVTAALCVGTEQLDASFDRLHELIGEMGEANKNLKHYVQRHTDIHPLTYQGAQRQYQKFMASLEEFEDVTKSLNPGHCTFVRYSAHHTYGSYVQAAKRAFASFELIGATATRLFERFTLDYIQDKLRH